MVLIVGCRGGNMPESYAAATGGDAHRGAALISSYNCGSCHMIPGIRRANGLVGPPLTYFGRRTFIAGEIPNNPGNLVRWIVSPQSVEPKTAMPALGLSDQQARDVAAYLYTLQ
jgi:cytochrome c1